MTSFSANPCLAPHLHNRFSHPNQFKIMQGNAFTGMSDKHGKQISTVQLNSISIEYVNYKRLDTKIFKDLLTAVLKQTIEDFSKSNNKSLIDSLGNFVTDCIDHFYRLLTYLRFTASENKDGELLSAPYGRLAVSKVAVFQNMAVSYGLNHADTSFSKSMPILDILKNFTEYELIVSYLMVLVHTIDSKIFAKYQPEFLVIIQAFQRKIGILCKNIGLYDQCNQILGVAKWWQESDYKDADVFKLFR